MQAAVVRWIFAVLVVALTTWLNAGIQALTLGRMPFLPYFLAIIVVTLVSGTGPAVVALSLSSVVIDWLWISPVGRLWPIASRAEAFGLGFFLLAGAAIIAVSTAARNAIATLRRARRELERTRRRLDAAHEAARMVEWEWDLRSGGVRLSRSARSVFGATWDGDAGAWPLVHPDDAEHVRGVVEAAVAHGRDYAFTSRMIRPDTGETRWIETRAVVHRGRDGAPEHVSGVTLDVTEKREALEAARLAEQRFVVALDSGAIIAWTSDAERRYTWVHNPGAGFHPPDFLGRKVGSLLPPEAFQRYHEAMDRVWTSGRGERIPVTWTRDGEARHFVSSIDVLRDARGERLGLVGASVDVTDLRRAEALALRSDERLRLALEGGRIGMWECDLVTGMTECTPLNNELFGLDPATPSFPTADWYRLIHPDDLPAVQATWAAASHGDGAPFRIDFRIVRPDGAVRWMHARAQFHADAQGDLTRAVGITMDVTERREAELALRDADRRKDEFLATLAHELRNPLAPLSSAAQLLRLAPAGGTVAREAQEMIGRQVAHMVRLVDDLLDVSRLRVGRIELQRERVALSVVLDHALEAAQPALDAGGHVLERVEPAEPLHVDADVVRLAQVFTNLLTNAARYTPRGGRIVVTAAGMGPDVVVTVRDDGVGIPPAMLGQVFDMFVQVPHADGRHRGGLGIGLSLSRRLVELHGGRLAASSEGVGRGSEFRVCLPRAGAPVAAAAAPPPAAGVPATVRRRVLVVDDNVDAAESLAMLLRLRGHEVRTASTGDEALAALDAARCEVLLLDLGLPRVDGYEVARRVRERFGPAAPRLVALTGWGQDADRMRTAEAGFDGHLLKPADPGAVAQVIEALAAIT